MTMVKVQLSQHSYCKSLSGSLDDCTFRQSWYLFYRPKWVQGWVNTTVCSLFPGLYTKVAVMIDTSSCGGIPSGGNVTPQSGMLPVSHWEPHTYNACQ